MDIIGKKNWFFILSGIVIIPGLISFFLFGMRLSIDFTGGSRMELGAKNAKSINQQKIENVFKQNSVKIHTYNYVNADTISIRSDTIEQKKREKIVKEIKNISSSINEKSFDTVGPTIGKETEQNALKAVLIASVAITLYIAFAFRSVSRPVASWKFGVCAVAALLHDVLVVVGVFSILGKVFGVEIDALFITALLTVMGFSVHDTIVVFDRIRENLKKNYNEGFDKLVNNSVMETFNRSLNTSLTVVIVLFTLLLFGGESIRWFIVALLVGIISGTYSSIFNASPLLVIWYEFDKRRKQNPKFKIKK
ncbi:MAG: protein translocase subunit SecF [Candidatus Levybacteria bacterium CG_4_10_14_0_2_um_filter_36_16]|nr:MAG: protein-export membrane protein SecF [Candidatus Levybacteria bacterium CG2_30_37_29]PIZ97969.1 MAG: protein translocase subunit SecF [Candidatus Levybacteria bacterium CG_4_10_14_0_2_um_filter_36_16]